jgi:hypothetical protein
MEALRNILGRVGYAINDSRADKDYGAEWLPNWLHRSPLRHIAGWPSRALCRWRGHPAGVWWYSSGYSPNMHCKGCGEDLG